MQLDENRIAIRQRTYLDVMDLALRVIRVYAGPLSLAFMVGVVPAMLLNAWLLADYADVDFIESGFLRYMGWMVLLVLWETPLVTAPITLYLGHALFSEHPRPAEIAREFLCSLPQMLWYQVIGRALFVPLVITWFFPLAAWAYLSEVILLERNPMHTRHQGQMTTARRRQALHAGYVGDLFARWLGSVAVGSLLFASLWLSIWLTGGMLLNEWEWTGATFTLAFPLAFWIVVGYFAVVRFLGYLDLRIRREGWEVELIMRAERARLMRQST
ncbi:MAG: hypothetical protein JXB62_19750 [Pirellulales bacterium]|nr:hypothetical protein [Pirellulales bacterium]